MVVAGASFVASSRSGRLDAPEDLPVDQDAERVVDRLTRDCADARADANDHVVGSGMGMLGDSAQDGQTLSSHLNAMLAEELLGLDHSTQTTVQFWTLSTHIRRAR